MQQSYEALQIYIEHMQILQYTLRSGTKCALYYCCQTYLINLLNKYLLCYVEKSY